MPATLPLDRLRLAGLCHERNEARGTPAGLPGAGPNVRQWDQVAPGVVAAKRPCGDCTHWRYAAGQKLVLRESFQLDLADIGWAHFVQLRELGRCALREDLLTHRVATCARWKEKS